ncbi:hypothetical protein [Bacillus sp. J14TS2]|nr:hypothetical protein [Bacillus sp. J14TS2]
MDKATSQYGALSIQIHLAMIPFYKSGDVMHLDEQNYDPII